MSEDIHNISVPSYNFRKAPSQAQQRAEGTSNATNFATPPPAVVNDGMGNYFEALRTSKDRSQIPYAMVHLRPQILRLLNGLNRKMLAAIGRYLVDNGGVASYAVNTIANYSCPVRAHSLCGDPKNQQILDSFFEEWQKSSDYTNRFVFDDLQRIACIAIDTDGDIGATITDKYGIPQVRFFDTFHIGMLTGMDPKDGVVTNDADGRLLGYRVCDGPIETITGAMLKFLPAEQLILLRDVDRYTNYRGFSPIRRGSNDLRDENDIKAFTKLKEKIGAALAAVIQQNGLLEEDVWGNDTGADGNAPGDGASQSDKKLSLAELLGGDIPVIEGELKQLQHNSPSIDTLSFLEYLAGQFVAGLDLPPAFFLDEKLTGPNVRAVLGKVQRKFDQRKAIMARFVEFCWLRVIGWAISKGQLPAIPNWWKIGFQFPSIITIDLGDMMANERADVLCGQMSERERFANRGKDGEREHTQIENEIRMKLQSATKLQQEFQSFNIPIEIILARMGFGTIALKVSENDANAETEKNKENAKDGGGKKDDKKKEDKK